MQRIFLKSFIGSTLLMLFLGGCKKNLDETPRSSFTPQYFETLNGVQSGITSLYAGMRNIYGNGYYLNSCQTGTDETTYGQNGDVNFKSMDLSGAATFDATSSNSSVLWNAMFPNINTASGVIQYGATAGASASLIAEAHFFRAFDYFMLVQTFGGVPLDLGSGVLKFNTSSVATSSRNTVADVYTKAIFPDLDTAISNLPVAARLTGAVTQTLARTILAKAYLTYGWWLENPNSIPTYPSSDRTDPNGHNAQWYYQAAYDMATTAISNPGAFGLQATYYDVNLATNDRNNEILFYADHSSSLLYGGITSTSYSTGGSPDNFAGWMEQINYPTITNAATADWSKVVSSVQRASTQDLGRPWYEMAPPNAVLTTTFADKTNDSRYDGTFDAVYRCNMNESGLSATYSTLYGANAMPVGEGDAVLTFLESDVTSGDTVNYTNATYKSNVGAGFLPGRADFVVEPHMISRILYPGNWKLGPYRTDNGTGLGNPNAGSYRPWNIVKFSELFFIAAEAAVKGATTAAVTGTYANDGTARGLINVLRARAGKWRFSRKDNSTYIADNSAAMTAATPATITIDYILAERSREYFGEGYRWYDLVRTQNWIQYSSSYTIGEGKAFGDRVVSNITRTITTANYLRPIPQTQLDAMQTDAATKAAYQNPGYN